VPKYLTDLRKRNACSNHLTGERVPETVWSDGDESRPPASTANREGNSASSERTRWCEGTQEDFSVHRSWTSFLQIGGDRSADILREWECVVASSFAVHHESASSPVDVIELHRCDLACAKAEADQHEQDRVISSAL
jgi:hypothetical protein